MTNKVTFIIVLHKFDGNTFYGHTLIFTHDPWNNPV
jgi:hypothetical protein